MPALANPRWERFAQCIVLGLTNGNSRETYSQGRAYIAAGYLAKDAGKSGGSAEAAASRLLKKVQPILARVRELQAAQVKRIDLSKERVGRRLNLASEMAEKQENPQAIVASETSIAKVFGHINETQTQSQDFTSANSMQDIGRKLLQSIGMREPDDASIALAIEANDAFIEQLEAIKAQAQATLSLDLSST